jgi:14-3-3 protein epsilon
MSGRTNLSDFGKDLGVEKLLELVRVAETAERYDDMCQFVKALVEEKSKKGQDLDVEERNLLSVAYKNVVGSKRASWRTLSGGFDDIDEALIDKYKKLIEKELNEICMEVINLLNHHLIKNVENKNDETEIFYLKMCGDYYRYLAEMNLDGDFKNKAKDYYNKAMEKANAHLPETHPTRLGLALNFSVCYYEILKEPEKACELAKKSFDAAIEKLDTLNDASYKDSTLIMQLLRDNLTLWTSEQQDAEED